MTTSKMDSILKCQSSPRNLKQIKDPNVSLHAVAKFIFNAIRTYFLTGVVYNKQCKIRKLFLYILFYDILCL